MGTKLTTQKLIDYGFRGEGKGITNNPLYRLEIEKHSYQFQVELGNYPTSNPNCGIVSLYFPEEKDVHCATYEKKVNSKKIGQKPKRIDYIESEDDYYFYGIKYISLIERQVHIAWYVSTTERLEAIVKALTGKVLNAKKK